MKIAKETFLINIDEILKLKDFCHFKAGTKFISRYINNCLFSYNLTETQFFYFLQKNKSNKCAILYIEDDSRDESLNSEKYVEKFLNEKEFIDFFKNGFSYEQ